MMSTMLKVEYYLANPNPKLKKSTGRNTYFPVPFVVPMCLLEDGASGKTFKLLKKMHCCMYSKNLQILGAEGGSGLLKFSHIMCQCVCKKHFQIPQKIQ